MNGLPAVRSDLDCDILYPRPSGLWPAVLVGGGFGTYDPRSQVVVAVDPSRDDQLPALGGWLRTGELVAYRPRQRATVRIASVAGNRYVKVLRPAKARKLEHLFTDVLGTQYLPVAPQLPELVDSYPAGGFLVFAEVGGSSLHESASTAGPVRLATVGGAVARFHSLAARGVRHGRDPAGLDGWMEWVARHDPCPEEGFRSELRTLALQLDPPAGSPSVLIHGDLHDKNVFLDGDRVGFIDLDSVRVGHPAEDLGNLAAHLVLRAIQADLQAPSPLEATTDLLRGYRQAGGVVSTSDVVALGAQTLLRLACVYRFRGRWRSVTTSLLRACKIWHTEEQGLARLRGGPEPTADRERIG